MARKRASSGGPLGVVLAVLFMVVWFAVGTWSAVRDWNIVRQGIRTTGTVLRAGICGGEDATGAYIAYADRDGHELRGLTQSCDAAYQPGDTIPLRYLPEDPYRIIADADVGDLWTWTIVQGVMYAIALVAVGLIARWLLHRRRRPEHLDPGDLLTKEGSGDGDWFRRQLP
jgi:hypothetical protein